MLRHLFIYVLFHSAPFVSCQSRRRQNYQVEWNSSNAFFHASSAVLNVRLGDTIDFLCPQYNQSSSPSSPAEYNTIYLVSEIDYNLCYTQNYQPLLRCDQPFSSKRAIYTLSISKYLPYPNMPEFVDGRSYYFISTSNGLKTDINQKFDGLCRTKNFRLIVDVQKYYRRYSIFDRTSRPATRTNATANQTNAPWSTSSGRAWASSSSSLLVLSFLLRCLIALIY